VWQSAFHLGSDERPAISVALRSSGSYSGSSGSWRYNQYRTSRDHTSTYRLPSKLTLPKKVTLGKSIKHEATPLPMKPVSLPPTSMLTDISLLPPELQSNPATEMKTFFQIKMLQRKEILDLWKNYEGDLCCHDVSQQDLYDWKLKNPDLEEADDIHFEYNFLTERFIIKCMPTPTHDTLQRFFTGSVYM